MTRRELEITDVAEIEKILRKGRVAHIGLVDEGLPYVVPMNYGFTLEDGKLIIYMHSAVKGYKVEVIEKNPVCCFEIETDVIPFEGDMPCQYGTSYSSVIGRGSISIISDAEEKIEAMKIFMKAQSGKDFEFTERLLSAVAMLRIDVDVFSAKHRPVPAKGRLA